MVLFSFPGHPSGLSPHEEEIHILRLLDVCEEGEYAGALRGRNPPAF